MGTTRPSLPLVVALVLLSVLLARSVSASRPTVYDYDGSAQVEVQTKFLSSRRGGRGRKAGGVATRAVLYEDDYEAEYEEGEYGDEAGANDDDGYAYYDDAYVDDDDVVEPWDEGGSGLDYRAGTGALSSEGEEDYEEFETDLGFDDEDEDEGRLEEEEEDFGDYYDDDNEDTEFFGFDDGQDRGAGGDGPEGGDGGGDDDYEYDGDAFGFEGGEGAFTSFCESADSPKIREDLKEGACDILVSGLDDNISKTHLHVDGVYKPKDCLNGYLRYFPAEGEDAKMVAFDVDFEEWGFYDGNVVAQENLILHGSSFEARVPQEVAAWYCDRKVCETDTENEHFWTPITSATITCITQEEEDRRIAMMGQRKNELLFPSDEDRAKGSGHGLAGHDDYEFGDSDGLYSYGDEGTALFAPPREDDDDQYGGLVTNSLVFMATAALIGFPLYIYTKQSRMRDSGGFVNRRTTKVRFSE